MASHHTDIRDATSGRPATMTRSAVRQARKITTCSDMNEVTKETMAMRVHTTGEAEGNDGGWVSVDHHRRRHRGHVATTDSGVETNETAGSATPKRQLRRAQTDVTHARADALSAAVTLDKKERERAYAPSSSSSPRSSQPRWGSPPPPVSRQLGRSGSMSPSSTTTRLERESSLQKLMTAWQNVEQTMKEQPGRHRNATRTRTNRGDAAMGGGGGTTTTTMTTPLSPPPPPPFVSTTSLRRSHSDMTASSSMSRGGRSPAAGQSNASTTNGTTTATTPTTNGTTTKQKCGDKRDFFFRNLEYETRNRLQIDDVAAFSVTDFEMAKKISDVIVSLFPYLTRSVVARNVDQRAEMEDRLRYPLVVTDATACVGGNVLSFADYFQHVYAVECDETRFHMLENNLDVLNKGDNVTCRLASYLDVMLDVEQDVVFFDPPWGGPEYKELDRVDLFLDDEPLYVTCAKLQGHAQCVVLKVPTNFDDEKFARNVPAGHVTVRRDFKKMHLVILDFRTT